MGRYLKIQAQYAYSVSDTNYRQQGSLVLSVEIKYADQMTKHCWKHGIGSVDKECCGLVGYQKSGTNDNSFLMRCRVLWSLEQWKEG